VQWPRRPQGTPAEEGAKAVDAGPMVARRPPKPAFGSARRL
jgi:hypothetical protein